MNGPDLRQALQAFFAPQRIVSYLFGSILLSVACNGLFQLSANVFGTHSWGMVGMLGSIVLLFLAGMALYVWQARQPAPIRPTPNPKRQRPRPRRGMIFLFGRPDVCREALKPHQASLANLWLICTPDNGKDAFAFASELQEGAKSLEIKVETVKDAHNPLEFYAQVRKLYENRPVGWSVDDVIADYTGLTASASIGLVQACLHEMAPIQYTPAEYDAAIKAIRPMPPWEVILQGQPGGPADVSTPTAAPFSPTQT